MKLNALSTAAGESVPIGAFTVLVGPNNVGKSQTLRDIYHFYTKGKSLPGVILSSIEQSLPEEFEDLQRDLDVAPHPTHVDHTQVRGIGSTLQAAEETTYHNPVVRSQFDAGAVSDTLLRAFGKFHVAHLDAASRLAVAASSDSFNPHVDPPATLLQGLFKNGAPVENELRAAFERTFGMDVRLDYSGMRQLSLRVAKSFPAVPSDPREAFPIMSRFPRLDDQGDGYRSFAGVVLSLLLARRRAILLDEPEAFLHPAQARRLGQWVVEHATGSGSQVIVATHNAHFLRGILAAGKPVEVFRLQRVADVTRFHRVSADDVKALTENPLLSSQSVLEALFHRGVVVCEADSDRVIYQTVANRLLGEQELLFVHSQGKNTVKDVCQLMRNAGTPTAAVIDIDILNSHTAVRDLGISLGATDDELGEWERRRAVVAAEIDGVPEESVLSSLTADIRTLNEQLSEGGHSLAGARAALRRIHSDALKWRLLKRDGVSALTESSKRTALEMISSCRDKRAFIVPVGELEGWIDVGTRQKKKWTPLALERLFTGVCPEPLLTFVSQVIASLLDQKAAPEPPLGAPSAPMRESAN